VTLPGPRSPLATARIGLARAPADSLLRLRERYGDVVAFGVGPFRYVALFGADANRFVLDDGARHFRWREALATLVPVVGETAVVVNDGEEHRRRRRLVQPAFATRRVAGYVDAMVEEIDRELDTWTPGRRLDAAARLRRAVRRVAVRTLFGDSLGSESDALGDALAAAIEFVNLPVTHQLHVDLPWTRWHHAKRARDRADVIVNREIARRRDDRDGGATGDGTGDPSVDTGDVLDALLAARDDETGAALDDAEIRDQVVSLVAAGFETTSAAAAWAVHELLVTPGAWETAAAEVGEVVGEGRPTLGHLARMPHLDAVVNETLRLWPPGFVSARYAAEGFEYEGAAVPAGSIVLYSPYVTQRDPALWPDPERFRPERWSGPPPAPYTFVPFGGGARRCIGFAFATQELKLLLVRMLQRVRLVRTPGPVVAVGTAALHPRHGVPVTVTLRRDMRH
jgi:cytochrome P450